MLQVMIMKKILVFTSYPAPYRTVLIEVLKKHYQVDVFFESAEGDERNKEWFTKCEINDISEKDGREKFVSCVKKIKEYDLVLLLEYSRPIAIKLIIKCKHKKVPYVLNCDGQMLTPHGSFLADIVKKYLVKGASGYLASGKHAKEYFLRYGAKEDRIYYHKFTSLNKTDILSKPLNKDEKTELRKKLQLPTDGKIAVAVGRFIPLKRYDVLIELWKDMPEKDYLLLIGGGSEKQKYEEIIARHNLKNVIIEDFHKFDELLNYFRAADIFVHPTTYDVWGLVVNEAMASGLPVVVSDTCVAGRELIVNGENGYLVKLYDDNNFIERVKEFLSNESLTEKAAANAIDTIKDFTVENMVSAQIENVEKILNKNAK